MRRGSFSARVFSLGLMLVFQLSGVARSQDALSEEEMLSLCVRVLSYDEAAPPPGERHSAVVYPAGNRSAAAEARRIASASSAFSGAGIRFTLIPFESARALRGALERRRITSMHLTAGLGGDIDDIVTVANQLDIPTLTGVVGYLTRGVAVGLIKERGRPRVVIHLPASRRQGMSLHGSLLRVATVLR